MNTTTYVLMFQPDANKLRTKEVARGSITEMLDAYRAYVPDESGYVYVMEIGRGCLWGIGKERHVVVNQE